MEGLHFFRQPPRHGACRQCLRLECGGTGVEARLQLKRGGDPALGRRGGVEPAEPAEIGHHGPDNRAAFGRREVAARGEFAAEHGAGRIAGSDEREDARGAVEGGGR